MKTKSLKPTKQQIYVLLVLSFFISMGAIIYGIFFDLDFSQIQRLTFEGLIITFVVIFPLILLIEWIFDLNNRKEFEDVYKRLERLERKH